jgi:predicted flavoprotein YhiN
VTALPKRLWHSLVVSCNISDTLCWGNVNKQQIRLLSDRIMNCSIEMTSKSTNKEEFVTAGGIDLSSIQMKTMASKMLQKYCTLNEY